jgi:hypothetical protein
MAAVLMEQVDKIRVRDLTGREWGYRDLRDDKHREFLRGMAWALCMLRGYELAFAETGDPAMDARLIDYRDQYQDGAALRMEKDCAAVLWGMIEEERGGAGK